MDTEANTPRNGTAAEHWTHELFVRLATFLKASFIYPSNNERVVASRELVRAALQDSPADPVVVRILGSGFQVGDSPLEIEHPLRSWLHETLLGAALGGVSLQRCTSAESLACFADELRRCYTADAASFRVLWTEAIAGVTPLELRFSGVHADQLPGPGSGQRVRIPAAARDREAPRDPLLDGFLGNPELMARLDELREVLTEQVGDGDDGDLTSIDLLDAISGALPVEFYRDPSQAAGFLDAVLARSRQQAALGLGPPGSAGESGPNVDALVTNLRRRFRVMTEVPVNESAGLPEGRKEDEVIVDDVDAMIAEFEKLPEVATHELLQGRETGAAEAVGVYLHLLVTSDDETVLERARDRLAALLREHPALEDRLVTYLDASIAEEPAHADLELWRVVAFAQDQQLHKLLSRADYLTATVVGRTFPSLFLTYLDRLAATGGKAAQVELDKMLSSVGTGRMVRVAEELVRGGDLLIGSRLRTALATGHEVMAPTIEHLARLSDVEVRNLVVGYLLKRLPVAAESAALRVVRPWTALSADYLADLARLRPGAAHRRRLRRAASRLIRSYLRSTAGREDLWEDRIRAVEELTVLPDEENLQLLRELRRGGVRGLLNPQQREFRRVVQRTYAVLKSALAD